MPSRCIRKTQEFRSRSEKIDRPEGKDFPLVAKCFLGVATPNSGDAGRAQLIDLSLGSNLTADSHIRIEPTDRPDDVIHYDVEAEAAARAGATGSAGLARSGLLEAELEMGGLSRRRGCQGRRTGAQA